MLSLDVSDTHELPRPYSIFAIVCSDSSHFATIAYASATSIESLLVICLAFKPYASASGVPFDIGYPRSEGEERTNGLLPIQCVPWSADNTCGMLPL